MKKFNPFLLTVMITALMLATVVSAQEKTTVTVKVEKDGKVVKDTTYQFDDTDQAKHALEMMEIMSGDDEHMMKVYKHMDEGHGGHSSSYVYVTKDGGKTEIKEISGDSQVWITEGEKDGDHVKVMKVRIKEGDETFDILIDEDHDCVKK